MVDYAESSQLNQWMFSTLQELESCRAQANFKARRFLSESAVKAASSSASATETTGTTTNPEPVSNQNISIPVEDFACGWSRRIKSGDEPVFSTDSSSAGPLESPSGHPYLTPAEEATLVSFYVSKLPSLIGPTAQIPRLRRESKVTATAALLLRRFFLSNSVMLYDPKCIMTAAAFLGAKVEDAMTDIRYLEEGTALMNAPVRQAEILPAELALLSGIHFDLLCFHPYKAVLALTEDLRTYLKSDKGKALVSIDSTASNSSGASSGTRPLSGKDLKPIYDEARNLLDDVVISDLPLLYSPGQVGMAALWVAQERVQQQQAAVDTASTTTPALPPRIDLHGYIKQRFDDSASDLFDILPGLCDMLQALQQGQYGCLPKSTTTTTSSDVAASDAPATATEYMTTLKAIHKKLKKVRRWGKTTNSGSGGGKKTNKEKDGKGDKKKNKRTEADPAALHEGGGKRQKTAET